MILQKAILKNMLDEHEIIIDMKINFGLIKTKNIFDYLFNYILINIFINFNKNISFICIYL